MIELIDVSKRFGDTVVLRGVTARVERGEIFAVIGPSGSGKSTLLRLINLLDRPEGGKIRVNGVDIHAEKEQRLRIRRMMGMVFQKPAVFNTTVSENIAVGLRFRGADKGRIREKVEEALDMVGLTGYGERRARTLSGGEMQRVALARAMVIEPEILLLDEPTANLDPVSVEKIEELVVRINRDLGTTIIFSTHDMYQGQRLAHRVGVLMKGGFAQVGTPREVFTLPATREVARFVGIENIIDGVVVDEFGASVVDAGGIRVRAGWLPGPGEEVSLCIRSEDLRIVQPDGGGVPGGNSLPGTVTSIAPRGPFSRVTVDCGFVLSSILSWKAVDSLGIREGSRVVVSFAPESVHAVRRDRGAVGREKTHPPPQSASRE
ncbi:ABC transporter ATP-binding protein [Methanoculleus bourgensis]|uniref:Molybdate/tungstate import ATP-binding protein WtpC n=1 Tax=Methanoculleus bourgensis TaxID=83986 RepID=A0A0X3BI76_9EURY|nr:ABC transporter ATP-binding protein [Methanoculleus bourgensis]CVK31866.1 Molybdate/tungstate import ATP-binding protein wtpC [Methanoculleus bourgensis]